jgi:hypothetical protein
MAKEQDISNSYLVPGTLVRYDGMEDEAEYGVVVHCWFDDDIQTYDCYVAFFGNAQPVNAPTEKPYILRYASTSLKKISSL